MFEAKCTNCSYRTYSFFEPQVQRLAEDHMMETGHIVDIKTMKSDEKPETCICGKTLEDRGTFIFEDTIYCRDCAPFYVN